jgi:hypothetical protein
MGEKEYQDKALECILLAEETRDATERLTMLEIAQKYLLLAIFAGSHLDQGALHRSTDKPADQGR